MLQLYNNYLDAVVAITVARVVTALQSRCAHIVKSRESTVK